MDRRQSSISPDALYDRLGTVAAPLLIDVRREPAFQAGETLIPGAIRRRPDEIDHWRTDLPQGKPVVVYCVHGHEVSQEAAATLRATGIEAAYLEGGIAGWAERGLPTRRRIGTAGGSWVTRENPKIDRIACPWLVRRFIDPEAVFLYVPADQVFATAAATGAIPYDIPGAEPFSHDGDFCSLDGFLRAYGLADPALDRLAAIVRGADTGRPELTPQSAGLLAISLGLSANFAADDHGMLDHAMPVYDALYTWCRGRPQDSHSWNPAPAGGVAA
jgi:rhodanese-related sulfurtransferase